MPISGQQFSLEKKVQKLFDELRPPAAAYRKYRRRAESFLAIFVGPFSDNHSPGQCITALRLRKSLLFGREYLVAYVNPTWFRNVFSWHDAIAADSFELGSITTPPLVFVPNTKRNAKGPAFLSILEHEFVHINQMILGTFPTSPSGGVEELMQGMFIMTRTEYEANIIQLSRWPQLYKSARERHGLSLEPWCVFRGYSQALERIVYAAAKGRIEGNAFLAFLDRLPAALPIEFKRLGFGENLGREYAATVERYALTALLKLADASPKLRDSLPKSLRGWLRSRKQQAIRLVENGVLRASR